MNDLVAEIRAGDCPGVVVTAEDLEYLTDNRSARERLVGAIQASDYSVELVVILREQVSYADSLFAELVKHGLKKSYTEFVFEILQSGKFRMHDDWIFYFDYQRMLENWRASNLDKIWVIPYEDPSDSEAPDIVGKFLTLLGVDHLPGLVSAARSFKRHNPRLNDTAVLTLHLLNQLEGSIDNPLNLARLRETLMRPPETDARLPLQCRANVRQRHRIRRHFRSSNGWIEREYGCRLGPSWRVAGADAIEDLALELFDHFKPGGGHHASK